MNYPRAIVELRPSKIILGEVGLFALKDFKKNEIVIDKSAWDESVLISWNEFETLDADTRKKLTDFCYKTDEGIYAPKDINRINIEYFFNHQCDPNAYCDSDGNYIARRDINIGEEFTIDVEASMKKTIKEFICGCGSRKCRHIIKI